jgi:hypothetical protein
MDDILKPYGTATVVLFSAQFDSQLPTVGKIKRALGTDHIKIYKSNGVRAYVVQMLERLLNHRYNYGNASHQPLVSSTHLIILPLGHYEKVFASLVFSAQLVGGFYLGTHALDELEAIDKKRWSINQIAETPNEIRRKLEHSLDAAKRLGLSDTSLQAAINHHDANFDADYGQTIAQEYQKQQKDWYEQYAWRDRRDIPLDESQSDVVLAA